LDAQTLGVGQIPSAGKTAVGRHLPRRAA
jgi:hypothetical protein